MNFDYPSLEDDQPKIELESPALIDSGSEVNIHVPQDINGQSEARSQPAASLGNHAAVSAAIPEVSSVKSIPTVDRSSKPKQHNEYTTSRHNLHSSSASSLSSDDDNTSNGGIITTRMPKTNSINTTNTDNPYTSASSSNDRGPSVSDATPANTRPIIPNRSLKPSTQDNINPPQYKNIDQEIDNAIISVGGCVPRTRGEIGNQDRENLASDETVTDVKKTGSGEIARMQQEHQIREQHARQELEKMRQEKIRTENKQLRFEKAEMEKQLEEQVEIFTNII